MRRGTPKLNAVERSLDLLEHIVRDRAGSPAHEIGRRLGLKRATVHRMVKTLEDHGQLRACRRGHYVAGRRLLALSAAIDPHRTAAELARPLIRKLAKALGHTVHLGLWEAGMTTYLVKEGGPGKTLITREEMQLESYCSGIGKVLLAHLPAADQEAYLASGPFVPLTRNTIVDPDELRAQLKRVRAEGFAIDDREVADDLCCLAVPIVPPDGAVMLALSAASIDQARFEKSRDALLEKLTRAAGQIARHVWPMRHPPAIPPIAPSPRRRPARPPR